MFRPRQEPQAEAPRWFPPPLVPLDHTAYLVDDSADDGEDGVDGVDGDENGHPQDLSGAGAGLRHAEVSWPDEAGAADEPGAAVAERFADDLAPADVLGEAPGGTDDDRDSSEYPSAEARHTDPDPDPEPEPEPELELELESEPEPEPEPELELEPEPEPEPEPTADFQGEHEPVGDVDQPLSAAVAVAAVAADIAAAGAAATIRLDDLSQRVEELARLRRHDADLVDRLHAENARLRAGELTEAMAPLLRGLMRLHDQMTSLGADDGQSVAGILRKQLLQAMDVAADVRPYTAVPGMPFDPARHVGVRRVGTDDPGRDRTIARTVKPGFVRGESTVVRPAEVEVFRAH